MAQSMRRELLRRSLRTSESIRIPLLQAEFELLSALGILSSHPSTPRMDARSESTTLSSRGPEDTEDEFEIESNDDSDTSETEEVVAREYSLVMESSETAAVMERVKQALEEAVLAGAPRRRLTVLLAKISHYCGRIPPSFTLQGITLHSAHPVCGGGYADIFMGKLHGQDVALKRFRSFSSDERQSIQERFCKETVIWRYLRHPHVLPFIGIDDKTFSPLLCMVSPWLDHGNMIEYITDNSLRADAINHLLLETSQGLQYLQEQEVIHGDLRCGNILIDDDGHARLADFGLSFVISASQSHATDNGGSVRWNAPESFLSDNPKSTRQSDVYAFGCVCLEAYTRKAPFAEIRQDHAVIARILQGARPRRPSPEQCSGLSIHDCMWTKVEQCWADSPSDRPNVKELIHALSNLPVLPPDSPVVEPHRLQLHELSDDPDEQLKRTRKGKQDLPSMAEFLLSSPHGVFYRGCEWPTTYHLLEAMRFMRGGVEAQHLIEMQDEVKQCATVIDVQLLVLDRSGHSRPDWDELFLRKVDEVLSLKFSQRPPLRALLLRTGKHKLQSNEFWNAPLGPQNQLGRALMRLRKRFREEPGGTLA